MTDRIETIRLILFSHTKENFALFNADLSRFEETYGVLYRGEELDYPLGRSTRKPKGQCKQRGIE